jgi:predicted Zn-dependent protease
MGHEIGHVTARHSASRASQAQLATLGLGLGSILDRRVARFGGVAETGLGLMLLKFGREDENQADELGLRYMTSQGYAGREMVEVMRVLERTSGSTAGKLPGWLSTHPSPQDRVRRLDTLVAGQPGGSKVNRDAYLRQIDGLVFGDDPRQGYFRGQAFYHPNLRFQIQFPQGWKAQNTTSAVVGASSGGDAAIVLTLTGAASAEAAAREFVQQQGVQATARRTDVNGLDATIGPFEAATDQGTLAGVAAFVESGGKVYRILGYSTADRARGYASTFERAIGSFALLTDRRFLDVQPMRIRTVRLERAMGLDEFVRRYPSNVDRATIARVNGLEGGRSFAAGDIAKQIVGGATGG